MQTIRIRNERPYFWQWDQNQQVEITGVAGPCQVHFTQQDSTEECLVVEPQYEGNRVIANVPNILLQTAAPITVYVYRCDEARYTDCHIVFNVEAREKPTDYVYTETEVLTWESLRAYCEEHAVTPDLQMGNVTTLPSGATAQASITGTAAQPLLHLGIPTGPQGETGAQGPKGNAGFSPTVTVTKIENGHRVAITDASGVSTFDVQDGAVQSVNGKTGAVQLTASDVGAMPVETWYGGRPVLTKMVYCGGVASPKYVDSGISRATHWVIGHEAWLKSDHVNPETPFMQSAPANVEVRNNNNGTVTDNYMIYVNETHTGGVMEIKSCSVLLLYVAK